jgi:tetratricopeptide (TPR) repeat protein
MNWLPVPTAALLACATLLAGCASADQRAQRAAEEAQVALQLGNTGAAREALQRAVSAKDDVSEYWLALGRVYVELQQYGDAYFAYARAVELDRSNLEALQTLSEIAVSSGRVKEAEEYVEQLEVLQPGNLGTVLVRGFIALRRRAYDDAIGHADKVLAASPLDQNARILKARALVAKGSSNEGVAVLEEHLTTRGQDKSVLEALLTAYRFLEDRDGIVRTAERLLAVDPDNAGLRLELARQLYRMGQRDRARSTTLELAKAPGTSNVLADILSLWLSYDSRSRTIADAKSLGAASAPAARLLYAQFMLEAGAPKEALRLLEGKAKPPVTSANANALAVLGRTYHALGSTGRARDTLDSVLAYDAGNLPALRARAELFQAEGRYDEALADASRAVAEAPKSAQDRLRLARVYEQKRDPQLASKTYWEAFQDIPANPAIYKALRTFLSGSERAGSVAALDAQFQRQTRLAKASALTA